MFLYKEKKGKIKLGLNIERVVDFLLEQKVETKSFDCTEISNAFTLKYFQNQSYSTRKTVTHKFRLFLVRNKKVLIERLGNIYDLFSNVSQENGAKKSVESVETNPCKNNESETCDLTASVLINEEKTGKNVKKDDAKDDAINTCGNLHEKNFHSDSNKEFKTNINHSIEGISNSHNVSVLETTDQLDYTTTVNVANNFQSSTFTDQDEIFSESIMQSKGLKKFAVKQLLPGSDNLSSNSNSDIKDDKIKPVNVNLVKDFENLTDDSNLSGHLDAVASDSEVVNDDIKNSKVATKKIDLTEKTPQKNDVAQTMTTPLTKFKEKMTKSFVAPPSNFEINIPYEEWMTHIDSSKSNMLKPKDGFNSMLMRYFKRKNKYCNLKFSKGYFKKLNGRKKNCHYFSIKAVCKHSHPSETDPSVNEKCLKFKFFIKNVPKRNTDVRIQVLSAGSYGHTPGTIHKDQIRGKERKKLATEVCGRPPLLIAHEKYMNCAFDVREQGNLTDAPTSQIVATIQKEHRASGDLDKDDFEDVKRTIVEMENDINFQGRLLKGYVRRLSYHPFAVVFYCENQLQIARKIFKNTDCLNLYLDATGCVARPPTKNCKNLYYYALVAKVKGSTEPGIPIAECFSSDQTICGIDFFLGSVAYDLNSILGSTGKIATKIETDFSFAMMQAASRSFNRCDLLHYINKTYEILALKKPFPVDLVVQHVCNSHVIKFFSNHISKFTQKKTKARQLAMVWFAALQKSKSLAEAEMLIYHGAVIFNSKYINEHVQESLNHLPCIQNSECDLMMDTSEIIERIRDDETIKKSQRDKSLYTNHFSEIISRAGNLKSESDSSTPNEYYVEKLISYMQEQLLAYFPLWSGAMFAFLYDYRDLSEYRETSSTVEAHMKKVKYVRQEQVPNVKVGRCIRNSATEIKTIVSKFLFPNEKNVYRKRKRVVAENKNFSDSDTSQGSTLSTQPIETWRKKRKTNVRKNYHKKSFESVVGKEHKNAAVLSSIAEEENDNQSTSEKDKSRKICDDMVRRALDFDYPTTNVTTITSSVGDIVLPKQSEARPNSERSKLFPIENNESFKTNSKEDSKPAILTGDTLSTEIVHSTSKRTELCKVKTVNIVELSSDSDKDFDMKISPPLKKRVRRTPKRFKKSTTPIPVADLNLKDFDLRTKGRKAILPILRTIFIVKTMHGANVDKATLKTLCPKKDLNDEIVSAFLGCISEKLILQGYEIAVLHPEMHCRIRLNLHLPHLRKLNLFDCDLVVVPIATGHHWYLCIFNMKHKQLLFLDSKAKNYTVEHAKSVLNPLLQVFNGIYFYQNQKDLNWLEWRVNYPKDHLYQTNSVDCGVYICIYAYLLFTSDKKFNFSKIDVINARKNIFFFLQNYTSIVDTHTRPFLSQFSISQFEDEIIDEVMQHTAIVPQYTVSRDRIENKSTFEYLTSIIPNLFKATQTNCFYQTDCLQPQVEMFYCRRSRDFYHIECLENLGHKREEFDFSNETSRRSIRNI